MDDFNPNDFADLSQLLGDVPAETPESGAAPTETPAVASPAPLSASPADTRTLAVLADIERRLLAIETLARRNGWSL